MFKGVLLSICILLTAIACNENEVPIEDIFQITVEDGAIETVDAEDWIIIHNQDGNIIDYKKLETGSTHNFTARSTIKNDQLSVTRLSYIKTNYDSKTQLNYSFLTHQNIGFYENWTIKNRQLKSHSCPPTLLQARIKLAGVSSEIGQKILITNKSGCLGVDDVLFSNGNYEGNLKFNENDNLLIRYNDQVGHLHYKFLKNLQNGTTYEFDTNSFDLSTLVVSPDINLSIYFSGVVNGFEDNQVIDDSFGSITGYNLFSLWGSDLTNIRLSYISDLKKYYSRFNVSYIDKAVNFFKVGNPISNLSKPTESVTIKNRLIDNFEFINTGSFVFYKSFFEYMDLNTNPQIRIGWEIQNKETKKRTPVTNIPDEILNKHPALKNISKVNLVHINSSFSIKSSMNYNDQISSLYKVFTPIAPDELILVYP